MIYLLSPGRSGTAWLSSILCALGLDCQHDLYPKGYKEGRDVLADTSWLWDRGTLLNQLKLQNAPGATDTIIVVERPREEIERSVAQLLGREEDWDKLFGEWDKLKDGVWKMSSILRSIHRFRYTDLFQPRFKAELTYILAVSGHRDKAVNIDRVWDFFVNMRITNLSIERDTIASHDQLIRN